MKYHIITYGCQMNKNDSERIAAVLQKMGMKKAKDKNSADFIVINTCSVRQTAEDRAFGEVNNFLKSKKTKPKLKMAVTGCMIGRDKEGKIRNKLKGVDFFFNIDDLPALPRFLAGRSGGPKTPRRTGKSYFSISPKSEFPQSCFLPIQTGCNEFCSYCTVPFSRGKEYNRPLEEILKETKELIRKGAIEIVLLGQIVNKWTASDPEIFSENNPYPNSFAALLWEFNQIKGLERIHFTAPHPRYVDDNFIKALSLPKMANYLHLPAQSGDDGILKKMNRKYAARDYLKIIGKIRKSKPGIALGTDLMVGFAGETEKQFKNTLDFYKKADFDIAYIAMYSPRSGTAANSAFADNIPREIKKKRWNALNDLMKKMTLKKNKKFVGKTVEVLVDNIEADSLRERRLLSATTPQDADSALIGVGAAEGERGVKAASILSGNSREMKRVYFAGNKNLVGKLADVKIKEAKEWILVGEISNS